MQSTLRMAAFRALAPNTGAGGGGGTDTPVDTSDLGALMESAFDAPAGEQTPDANGGRKNVSDDEDDEEPGEGDDQKPKEPAADDKDPNAPDDADKGWELDPKVAEALPPEVKARWESHVAGLEKEKAKVAEGAKQIEVLGSFQRAFDHPDHAGPALQVLVKEIAAHHGKTVEQLLGLTPQVQEQPKDVDWKSLGFESKADFDAAPDWQQAGFESRGEHKLFLQNEALQKRLDALEASGKQSAEQTAAQAVQQQFETKVKAVTPAVQAELSKAHVGWQVTPEMVSTAMKQFPNLEPARAVEASHAQAMAKHYHAVATKGGSKFPDLSDAGSTSRGIKIPAADDGASFDETFDAVYAQIAGAG